MVRAGSEARPGTSEAGLGSPWCDQSAGLAGSQRGHRLAQQQRFLAAAFCSGFLYWLLAALSCTACVLCCLF